MSYPAAYDGSTRFLDFVTEEIGIPSYLSARRGWKLATDRAFYYSCYIPRKTLVDAFKDRPLVLGRVDELPPGAGKKPRRTLPPKLLPSQLRRLSRLTVDTEDLIAFPLVLHGSSTWCEPKTNNDTRSHLIVLILNKRTGTVELFDDKLPQTIRMFGMSILINNGLDALILPKLQTLVPLGPEGTTLKLSVPRFNERHYKAVLTHLTASGYPSNNYTAHAAFTANFLAERKADPSAAEKIIHDRVFATPHAKFIERYASLHDAQPLAKPCTRPVQILNPETLRCVNADGITGRMLQGVKRSRRSRPSRPIVNLHEHFLDTAASVDYLRTEIGDNTTLAMTYLRKLYGNIATIATGEFVWNCEKLQAPRNFSRTWDKGLSDRKRFIVVGLRLQSETIVEAHANSLIYDMETRELERFEPNGGAYNIFCSEKLDRAIIAWFDKRIGAYIPPIDFCPIGVQALDANEKNNGVKDIGGNCAAWALYFMELRLSNPLLSRKDVLIEAIRGIKKRGSFAMFINGYHRHVQLAMRRRKNVVRNTKNDIDISLP